ncbi:MAG TPA: hypothetical protein VGI45_04670 [Terracidiphilus sp.]|jgi:hypothetical protein
MIPSPRNFGVRFVTSKPFLRAIYEDWYRAILERLPMGEGSVLELGSGAGFFPQFFPT